MAAAHPLTDHDEIREWAEARDAKPTCVRGTGGGGDTGMIRLDFPGYSGAKKLQPITWEEWFTSFDENNLALLVQDRTARGQQSNFNKLVARKTAAGEQPSRRAGLSRGTRKSAAAGVGAKRKTATRKTATRKTATRKTATRKTATRKTAKRTVATRGVAKRSASATGSRPSRSSSAKRARTSSSARKTTANRTATRRKAR